jgi:hypothetical protein
MQKKIIYYLGIDSNPVSHIENMDKNPPIPEIIFSRCETGFESIPR